MDTLDHHFELSQREYSIVHRLANAIKTKYGIRGHVQPVTMCVLSLDRVKQLSLVEYEQQLQRSARQVTQLIGEGDGAEETKRSFYGSFSVPVDQIADMARCWYAQLTPSLPMTLKTILLSYFHLLAEHLTLERSYAAAARRRRGRGVAFADESVFTEEWSGESTQF